jgi:hypothetical protein
MSLDDIPPRRIMDMHAHLDIYNKSVRKGHASQNDTCMLLTRMRENDD